MNNLSSYCGLVGAKIRASDKDLPVQDCNGGMSNFAIVVFYPHIVEQWFRKPSMKMGPN